MTAPGTVPQAVGGNAIPGCTLVWLDSREAIIVRWDGRRTEISRIDSDVPAHHRTTGHIRHEPSIRHGGGGPQQTAGEPNRLEHLDRFVAAVASRLPPDEDLFILGPGTVRDRLERSVRKADRRHGRDRTIGGEASPRRSDRQLIARLRSLVGDGPRRRTVGAYRWSEQPLQQSSGHAEPEPRRVTSKRPSRLGRAAVPASGDAEEG